MSQIVQQGAINLTALFVPDLYVQIVPPAISQLNGVPTDVAGVVGTATWGPVGAPTLISSMSDYAKKFGALQPRKYDLGTAIAIAVLQGSKNFRAVRVTDGTDVAASVVIQATCLTLTSFYSGTLGNACQAVLSAGSAANTWKITIAMPGQVAEVFDNIAGTGNALWQNMANAINNGQGLRAPSVLVIASAGVGVTVPTAASFTLAGGTDGTTTITGTVLVGVDSTIRKGMYALRGTGASLGMLADCDDSTTWSLQTAFALSEGIYMIGTGPAGDAVQNAVTVKGTAGIDSSGFKLLQGDWIYFNDTVNQQIRLVSPQAFELGTLANLAPQESSLNKQQYGIVGTQRTQQGNPYSSAELQLLAQAGIDVITNPIPAGQMFGARIGHNSSSNSATNGDNYTRMTNYLSATMAAGMGKYVGKLQGTSPTDPLRRKVKITLDSFLQNMVDAGQIDSFSVQCDLGNNSLSRISNGYLQVDVSVKYLGVVEKMIINMQGGQTVTITKQSTTPTS